MGCAQSRDQTEEQEIEDREKDLGFHKFTISQIKQAFFIPSGPESINLNQLQKAIDDLELSYNEVELESYSMFISGFLIDPKEEVKHYNLKTLLLAIFLLSKSSQKEKAAAMFDIYDEHCDRKLTRDEIKAMLISVIEVVFSYSEKLLDNDEGMIQMHHEIVNAKEEELMGKLFSQEFEKMKVFKKDEFCQWIAATATKFVDFTNPKHIREVVMDFVLHTKKTQVELQQIYKLGIKRSETIQKHDSDLTNDNTPSASGHKEGKH